MKIHGAIVNINTAFIAPSDSTNSLLKIRLLMKLRSLINSKIIISRLLFNKLTEGYMPFNIIQYIVYLVKKINMANYSSDGASIVRPYYCKIKVL